MDTSYVFSVSSDTSYASDCQQHNIHLLLEICGNKSSSNNAIEEIKQLISTGSLSKARKIAYECLYLIRGSNNVKRYDNIVDVIHCCLSEDKVIQAYTFSSDIFYNNVNFLDLIKYEYQQYDDDIVDNSSSSSSDCWSGNDDDIQETNSISFGVMEEKDDKMSPGSAAIDRWNGCCSYFQTCDKKSSSCIDKTNDNRYLCCELAEGLDNHLILPALREPTINIRVKKYKDDKSEDILIEQEGSLRQFDVSGVLWPAGYLLGLCLSNPVECGMPEIIDAIAGSRRPFAVELGCGVGFPSIAFAKFVEQYMKSIDGICDENNNTVSPIIVSTDTSNISLALTKVNAQANDVGELVIANNANHSDLESLSTLHQRVTIGEDVHTKFDVILGSSLQSLFDGLSQHSATLWQSLDTLLSNNKDAVVVLSHVRSGNEQIVLPPESERLFEVVRRVSGDKFGMYTRDGSSSDFELVLLRRRR